MKKKQLQERKDALEKERAEHLAKLKAEDKGLVGADLEADDARVAELAKIKEELAGIERLEQRAKENVSRTSRVEVHDNGGDRPWAHSGEFLSAVVRAGTPGGAIDPRLHAFAPTGLNEGVGEQGGFLVTPEMSTSIWQRVYADGQVLSRVDRRTVGPNSNGIVENYVKENARTAGNRFGGIQVYRRAEAATATATKPTLAQMKMELESTMALVYATDEQLADAPQLVTLFNNLVPKAIRFSLEDEIINGNGVGKCLGVLNAPSLVSITKETGQLAATIQAENINKMWARLTYGAESSAVWFINKDVQPQLDGMTIGAGAANWPVYLPAGGLSASPYGTLKGRPVIPIEHCATLGTVGDIILADLSQYVLIEKGGVETATSIHVQFLYGEQVFRFKWRNMGGPGYSWAVSALTPAKGSNTLSPFVALATRA